MILLSNKSSPFPTQITRSTAHYVQDLDIPFHQHASACQLIRKYQFLVH